ncbi:efflux RND transporter permease subunit [Sporohalobacter salinus]|uniref:efflux RND transporter permease subunit n=1 Tax=Sporohalobacter salinus TaxID=1494606 RepID=UPI00195FB397|nr:MMPL family transporter [Sporohalobacter salinus]MBM7624108.1 putative RND superfamily exporter protein [Sporohalobacter salinus]
MRKKLFNLIADLITSKPKQILAIAAVITLIMLVLTSNLNLELSWVGLAPKGDPSQKEYKKIIENYPSAGNIYVTVKDENGNPTRAARLAVEALEDIKYIKDVNYKLNTDYLLNNGLLLYKTKNLSEITPTLKNPNLTDYIRNLNQVYEDEYRGDSDNIKDDEKELVRSFRGIKTFLQTANTSLNKNISTKTVHSQVDRLLLGDPYFRSNNGKLLLMTLQPTFNMMDYSKLEPGIGAVEKKLKELEQANPNYHFGLTGMHVIVRDEMVTTTQDSTLAMIMGFILVIIILVAAFKMWLSPLLAAIPLITGIIWDLGLASIFIGRLNLITAFTAAILIGLGIDFSVHTLSGYTEAKSNGLSAKESVYYILTEVAPAILTGALTTAAAFFALTVTSLGVLVELGIIMGIGILTTVVAVLFILPTLLFLRTKKFKEAKINKGRYYTIGTVASWTKKFKYAVIPLLLIILAFMGWQGKQAKFYLNIEKIEPQGLESIKVTDKIADKFDMSNDAIMYTTDSLNRTYSIAEWARDKSQVEMVRTITDYLPPKKIQQKRLKELKDINKALSNPPSYHKIERNKLVAELIRLQKNIIEIGQLSFMSGVDEIVNVTDKITGTKQKSGILPKLIDKLKSNNYNQQYLTKFSQDFYKSFEQKCKLMKIEDTLSLEDVPQDIKSRFLPKSGNSFLTSVHAQGHLWKKIKKPTGERFIYMMREKIPKITGAPVFMRVLYDAVVKEATKSLLVVGVTLLILLMIHFRSVKQVMVGFVPMVFALIMTLGMVKVLKVNLDIISALAFPLIVGIGIDDCVHVIHRLNATDEDLEMVFSSAGRAILLTSLTTMASFGSLMIANYQAIFRMGVVLFVGVAFCFLMTLFVVPIFLDN